MFDISKIKKLGLIVGNGKFPFFLCKSAIENNIELVVIAINNEANVNLSEYSKKIYSINLGEGRKLLDILNKEDIKHIIMTGKIRKTTILKQSFKMDKVVRGVLKNAVDKRDDAIIKAVESRLSEEGVELLDSTKFLKDLMTKEGVYTKAQPSKSQKEDINFGFTLAKKMGALDIGQTIIVKDKAIIAVEAIEGTDEAIIRAGNLTADSVVVKTSKPDQDMRFDVPTVGLNTIMAMKKANACVLAIEANKTLILEKEEAIKQANEANICIIGIR